MKILYLADLWEGSTSLQRVRAFERQPEVDVVAVDTGVRLGTQASLWHRVRWRLRWPVDLAGANELLLKAGQAERPDAIIVDNSKVIGRDTLRTLKREGRAVLAYYTGDDIMARHNLSHPLRRSFPEWDLFFTTKTFNVEELRRAGVRRPVLIGKAFDPGVHRPLRREEIGADFERFDIVFIGTHEAQRRESLNALAESGLTVVVYGGGLGGWPRKLLHHAVELRDSVFEHEYTRAMHHGKLALCFLRKANRDRITQRTMEIAAMGRPMLAEKTEEHDQHFVDGEEYLGFRDDASLVATARQILSEDDRRESLGRRIRERALESGYSSDARASEMIGKLAEAARQR